MQGAANRISAVVDVSRVDLVEPLVMVTGEEVGRAKYCGGEPLSAGPPTLALPQSSVVERHFTAR
jgi:hypothetical protein